MALSTHSPFKPGHTACKAEHIYLNACYLSKPQAWGTQNKERCLIFQDLRSITLYLWCRLVSAELGNLAQALAQHLPELVAQESKEENAYIPIPDPSSALHGIQPPSSSSHTPTTSSCPSSDDSFPWGQASASAHDAQVQQYPDIMHEQFKALLQVLKNVTASKLGVRPSFRLILSLGIAAPLQQAMPHAGFVRCW